MSVHASHPTPDPEKFPNFEELLIAHLAQGQRTQQGLLGIIENLEKPARVEPIVLNAAQPIVESGALTERTLGVGLYNPSGSLGAVNFSVFGSASVADAFVVPAGKLLVLPISAGIIEVGTNFAFGAGQQIYAFLLRYSTVPSAFYGG